MHELSVAQALIDQTGEELHRRGLEGRVQRLEVVVGRLSGVHVDALRLAFQALAPGTVVEHAVLDIDQPAAICRCGHCGQAAAVEELMVACPVCGSADVVIDGGRELLLRAIELEEQPESG